MSENENGGYIRLMQTEKRGLEVVFQPPFLLEWVEKVKLIIGRKYDAANRRWLIPDTEDTTRVVLSIV